MNGLLVDTWDSDGDGRKPGRSWQSGLPVDVNKTEKPESSQRYQNPNMNDTRRSSRRRQSDEWIGTVVTTVPRRSHRDSARKKHQASLIQHHQPAVAQTHADETNMKKHHGGDLIGDTFVDPAVQRHMDLPLSHSQLQPQFACSNTLPSGRFHDTHQPPPRRDCSSKPLLRFNGPNLEDDIKRCMRQWMEDERRGVRSQPIQYVPPPQRTVQPKTRRTTRPATRTPPRERDEMADIERQMQLLIVEQEKIWDQIKRDRMREREEEARQDTPELPTEVLPTVVHKEVEADQQSESKSPHESPVTTDGVNINLNGKQVRLKSQQSVRNALKNGSGMKKMQCPICRNILLTTDQAATVLCPVCKTLSAID